MGNIMNHTVVIDLDVTARVERISSLIEREMRTAKEGCHIFIYGGYRDGGKSYQSTCTGYTATANVSVSITKENEKKLKALSAQWNRAKATRNKNEMRDIERKMQCIRGY